MQEQQQTREISPQQRRLRLKRIVIAHLLIVVTFFVAAFLWGNFE